ncbi:MAG: C40 family peptidase [Spirochaetes bacterium]|nr:C40 family peptidase [Spirochaetota bacterium]
MNLREKEILRNNIIKTANSYAKDNKIKIDCSGLILKILEKNYVTIFKKQAVIPPGANGVKIIYSTLKRYNKIYRIYSKIRSGDLIFFSNTYDKNRNRINDDTLTHIAIIVDVDNDGTITYVHTSSKGVVTGKMNLRKRGRHTYKNKEINSNLRRKTAGDTKAVRYLSGELFYSFGTIF